MTQRLTSLNIFCGPVILLHIFKTLMEECQTWIMDQCDTRLESTNILRSVTYILQFSDFA